VHIAESDEERRLVERAEGIFATGLRARGIVVEQRARSSIALLARTGVLDARPLLIHCVRVDAEDIDAMASHDCAVAHCPISNAKLGHGTAPLLDLLQRGVRVGLGSDSVASNNRMDISAEARAAILAQRARTQRHDALCASDAVRLATLGGASALGLDTEIGSLEVGKSADLAAFPLDPHTAPVHDPFAAVVFALPGTGASLVTVAGRELVRDGRLTRRDDGLTARVDDTVRRMRDWDRSQAS
jgi:cytosine/adenosine deaminase-related metal-dependent hydrolase